MTETSKSGRLLRYKFTHRPHYVFGITILIIGIIPGWLFGCASPSSLSRAVVEDSNRMVRLDVTYREGDQEHSHPAKIAPETLYRVLQSVTVTPHSFLPSNSEAEEREAAFSEEQLHFFAQYVSKALERATPLEEALFFWSEKRDQAIQEVTSGSCYIQDQSLHLVFANYRQASSGRLQVDQARENPQYILGGLLYQLQPGAHGQILSMSQWEHFLESATQHLVFAVQEFENVMGTSLYQRNMKTQSSETTSSPIQEKLETLQQLHQNGLITDKEFQEKKNKILEHF